MLCYCYVSFDFTTKEDLTLMSNQSKRLVNTCRWSSSRENTFNECRKKYWYSYYGAWEGWPKTPYDERESISPLSSLLYGLKNIQPLCVFTGSVVHKVIENSLKKFAANRIAPKKETLVDETRALFQKGLYESKEELWKKHPKKYAHIAEHHFAPLCDAAEEASQEEKAISCSTNWIESPCVQNLIFHPKARVLGTEASHTFALEKGVEAIVVYDFYLDWPKSDGSSVMIIFDWKTGKENQKIEDQLVAYALAAQTLFGRPLEDLILCPFYLAEGPNGYKKYGVNQPFVLKVEQLNEIKNRCIASAKEMLAFHPQEDNVCPDPRLFSYTEDKRKCRRCCYQDVCQKVEYNNASFEELGRLAEKPFTSN